ncbi:MAG TPA: YlmC/YmxH family sporulation protein [Clostridiaceae bacterium]|jgi:YlmC/YmxH family sporulation protein|nr:YlmC/YmxH family sporulation protein [Clostridiaceae bacterium]
MFIKFNYNEDEIKPGKKRLSEIGGQEIINLYDGGRMGMIADIDLLIDDKTGAIEALLVPESKGFFSIKSDKNYIKVPWDAVRKIGQDALIIEMDERNEKKRF